MTFKTPQTVYKPFHKYLPIVIWRLLKQYPMIIAVLIVLSLLQAATEGIAIVILAITLGKIGIGGSGTTSIGESVSKYISVDVGIEAGLGLIVIAGIVSASISGLNQAIAARTSRNMTAHFQISSFRGVLRASWDFLSQNSIGDATSIMAKYSYQAGDLFPRLVKILTNSVLASCFAIMAVVEAPQLVFALSAFVFIVAIPVYFSTRRISRLMSNANNMYRGLNNQLTEYVGLAMELKANGIEEPAQRALDKFISSNAKSWILVKYQAVFLKTLTDTLYILLVCSVLYLGVVVFRTDNSSLTIIVLFMMRIAPRILDTVNSIYILPMFSQVSQTVDEYIARAKQNKEIVKGDVRSSAAIAHGIEFKAVTVEQAEGNVVLRDIDAAIRPGQLTIIMGASGSGKTTMANVILGLVRPSEGQVLIDGTNLFTLQLQEWRQSVGFVSQNVSLFDGTIRENFTNIYGPISDQKIKNALQKAEAWDFIETLPGGLDHSVGSSGARISGGQRQRLGIARILIKNPCLLVLDEPTSALDEQTAMSIMRTFSAISRSIPTVVITHDEKIADFADKIYYLEAGKIVEEVKTKQP